MDYLTLVDWLFLVCYIEIFLVITECIAMRRLLYRWEIKEKAEMERREAEMKKLGSSESEAELEYVPKKKRRYVGQSEEKKTKTRLWIEKMEDIFFGCFVVFTFFLILIVSVIAKFA